jgi:hypothetical protein
MNYKHHAAEPKLRDFRCEWGILQHQFAHVTMALSDAYSRLQDGLQFVVNQNVGRIPAKLRLSAKGASGKCKVSYPVDEQRLLTQGNHFAERLQLMTISCFGRLTLAPDMDRTPSVELQAKR